VNRDATKEYVLKQVFDLYVEESITDNQVSRVLDPVIKLIMEGVFNRPRWFSVTGGAGKIRPVELFLRNARKS